MTADLEKILATLEQQNEIIANLKAENEQLRQQVATERSHKKAYQTRLRELEPPPNEQEKQQPTSENEQIGIVEAVQKLSVDEQYRVVKEFVNAFETKLREEKQRLIHEHKSKFAKEIKRLEHELGEVMAKKPMFQFWLNENWNNNVKGLEQEIKKAKYNFSNIAPVQIESQALDNIHEKTGYPEFSRKEIRKAKSFVIDYERKKEAEFYD